MDVSKILESPANAILTYFFIFFLHISKYFCRGCRLFKFKQIIQICVIFMFGLVGY